MEYFDYDIHHTLSAEALLNNIITNQQAHSSIVNKISAKVDFLDHNLPNSGVTFLPRIFHDGDD